MARKLEKSLAVSIPAASVQLAGDLVVPDGAIGTVLFAHGSGSSRLSPRNRSVARALQERRIATLLLDLLTEEEAEDRANVFDIDFLAERLRYARRFVEQAKDTRDLPVGYFGASTGAAAALVAAAGDELIRAVVSRGGRPDLARDALPRVSAPTLLIVGGNDFGVIELNEDALRRLRCEKRLEIVPGATHLFEEPGTLEQVMRLATDWFAEHFATASSRPASRRHAERPPPR
ncbi:MAG: dienelactone hydrolase family protein [Thermodesulfobacteriota bacterium]